MYNLKFVKWRKSVDFNFGVKEIYKPNIRVFFNKKILSSLNISFKLQKVVCETLIFNTMTCLKTTWLFMQFALGL